MDWTDRAEAQRKALGLTKAEVARRLGIGASTYSAAIAERRRNPSSFSLYDLANELSLPPLFLKEGITEGGQSLAVSEGFVKIPIRDVYASAGSGSAFMNGEIIGQMVFNQDSLNGVSRSRSLKNLNIIHARGDSMQPLIYDGDHMLVDSGINRVCFDGIFVFSFDDGVFVKRLAVNPVNRTVSLKSDNPAYQDFHDIPVESLHIAGEVVWLGRNLVRWK